MNFTRLLAFMVAVALISLLAFAARCTVHYIATEVAPAKQTFSGEAKHWPHEPLQLFPRGTP